MKNLIKNSAVILAILLGATIQVNAAVGTDPTPTNSIELKALANHTIQVTASISTTNSEYYQLEKSYDNKTFSTVCILMPFDETDIIKPIVIKDKIKEENTKIYYRIIKVEQNKYTCTAINNIEIK
jgi:hypothetical protein